MKSLSTGLIFSCLAIAVLSACIGVPLAPDRIAPDFENPTRHEIKFSDSVLTFEIPGNQRIIARSGFASEVDKYDENLYSGRYDAYIGRANWEWQPRRNVNGSIQLTIWMERFPIAEFGESETLVSKWKKDLSKTRDPGTYRFKETRQFSSDGPSWMIWDHPDPNSVRDSEVFFHALDSEHVLRIQFGAVDNSHDKPENQDWYEEAERLVDEVMASIRIEHQSDYAPMEYGVPNRGLVEPGTLRYFDSISKR